MFVQWDVDQATDKCAIMQVEGWLYCWLSKHNTSSELTHELVKSFQEEPIYATFRESEDIVLNLLFTKGDRKTSILLGCNPRSSDGMSMFKKTLHWAKPNGLSIEIAPNIQVDDAETQHLLLELGLSQSTPGAIKANPFWKKLFGRNK